MNTRRSIGILLLVLHMSACTHFVAYPDPPVGAETVRITVSTGDQYLLSNPTLEGGTFAGPLKRSQAGQVVSNPVEQITRFEVEEIHTWRTVGAVSAAVLGALILVTHFSMPKCGPSDSMFCR